MAQRDLQFFLNTENCQPIYELVAEIRAGLRENEKIISRITDVADLQLRFPTVDGKLGATEFQTKQDQSCCKTDAWGDDTPQPDSPVGSASASTPAKLPEGGSNHSSQAENPDTDPIQDDYLRNYLDVNLNLQSVGYDESHFEGVENKRIRQLLVDNYRLLEVRRSKQQLNKELFEVYKKYEKFFGELVIPALTRDINSQNIERIHQVQTLYKGSKFPADDLVWNAYNKYIESVERVRDLAWRLVKLLEDSFHGEAVERLGAQIGIVEELIHSLKLPQLRSRRNKNCDSLEEL